MGSAFIVAFLSDILFPVTGVASAFPTTTNPASVDISWLYRSRDNPHALRLDARALISPSANDLAMPRVPAPSSPHLHLLSTYQIHPRLVAHVASPSTGSLHPTPPRELVAQSLFRPFLYLTPPALAFGRLALIGGGVCTAHAALTHRSMPAAALSFPPYLLL